MTKRQGSTGSSKVKEEGEDATLASKKQKGKRKRDLLKIKCFRCGELGHFTTNCPLRKKDKEASSSKAAAAQEDDGSDDDVAMSAHVPREKR